MNEKEVVAAADAISDICRILEGDEDDSLIEHCNAVKAAMFAAGVMNARQAVPQPNSAGFAALKNVWFAQPKSRGRVWHHWYNDFSKTMVEFVGESVLSALPSGHMQPAICVFYPSICNHQTGHSRKYCGSANKCEHKQKTDT